MEKYKGNTLLPAICWRCIHAVPDEYTDAGCIWSERGMLVEGSTFVEMNVCYGQKLKRIVRCPKFEWKGRRFYES